MSLSRKLRLYEYVGPAELLDTLEDGSSGREIADSAELLTWISARRLKGSNVTATFVIDHEGRLRLADRRSEHVYCAEGRPVLSAGEVTFNDDNGLVTSITNQSTGYCPEPESWPSVEAALRQIGVSYPDGFTSEFFFRRCPACRERNIVRDNWSVCAVCDADLPRSWNFSSPSDTG